jgi:hypothetical protein
MLTLTLKILIPVPVCLFSHVWYLQKVPGLRQIQHHYDSGLISVYVCQDVYAFCSQQNCSVGTRLMSIRDHNGGCNAWKREMRIWIALSSGPISIIFCHRLEKLVTEKVLMLWILRTK